MHTCTHTHIFYITYNVPYNGYKLGNVGKLSMLVKIQLTITPITIQVRLFDDSGHLRGFFFPNP